MTPQSQPFRAPLRADGQSSQAVFTLCGRDIARLDRFIIQGERAARRAERGFDGVTLEVDVDGSVSVTAVGVTPIRL